MKELEINQSIQPLTNTEIVSLQEKQIEHILEGKIMPSKSHKIYEVNVQTGEVKEASYRVETTVAFSLNPVGGTAKLIMNKGCVYIPALNAKNARKKYEKNSDQSFYFFKGSQLTL